MADFYQSFKGKNIFVTGTTGFVGKVFLWKLLKEFPDLGNVYLLVRAKKNVPAHVRAEKEVLGSTCFEGLAKELGPQEWQRRRSKVIAMPGDIMYDHLGLSTTDYATLVNNCHQIVHLAATVDFNEKLNLSVQMNVLGPIRVMALAHKCKQLEAFVHVSTCYVNWNRASATVPVKEQLYPLPFNPEDMCKYILSLHDSQVPAATLKLQKQWRYPNTYTFTKTMAEQILSKRKARLPFCIIRPSIVGASHREPYPGWVDALTAAGGLMLTMGLGIVRELHCDPNALADVVPVDFLVSCMIKAQYKVQLQHHRQKALSTLPSRLLTSQQQPTAAAVVPHATTAATSSTAIGSNSGESPAQTVAAAAAHQNGTTTPALDTQRQQRNTTANDTDAAMANQPAPQYLPKDPTTNESDASLDPQSALPLVFQCSTTSSMNPLRWGPCYEALRLYNAEFKHPKRIADCDAALLKSRYHYLARIYVLRIAPLKALQLANQLPGLHDARRGKDLARLQKAINRSRDLDYQFKPFITHEWIFESTNTDSLDEGLPESVRGNFAAEIYDINWQQYCQAYAYGLIKYIMRIDDGRPAPKVPKGGSTTLLQSML